MSNLEESIKDCITKELEKGIIEKVISEKLEECVSKALDDMFGYGGTIKKVIKEKVKSVMIPYLENYDYSKYIVKLDAVMVDVLKATTKDNKEILENFKELMGAEEFKDRKVIKVTELFNKWCEHVEEEVETNGLEVVYEEDVSYESIDVSYEFEEMEERSYNDYQRGRIVFECEHDEKMNICIDVYRWKSLNKKGQWHIESKEIEKLSSLRNLKKFEVFLIGLQHSNLKVEIDKTYDNDSIVPSKKPEAYFV